MAWLYECAPLDYWPELVTLQLSMSTLDPPDDPHQDPPGVPHDPVRLLGRALCAGAMHGWEGDFRPGGEPQFFPLPANECEVEWGVIWKQDNNGTTYVYSPFRLPWLAEFYAGEAEVL